MENEIDLVCASLKIALKVLKKDKAKKILELLINSQKPLTVEEIVERIGLSKATVYVNLKELRNLGFVKTLDNNRPRKFSITDFTKKLLELPKYWEEYCLINIKKLVK